MKNLLGFLIIPLMLLVGSQAFGATIYVDNSGCGDCADYRVAERDCGSGTEQNYDTIQEAVDALSAAGDIIDIRPGTYAETVTGTSKQVGANWGSPITIRGHDGDAMPVIDGQDSYAFLSESDVNYYWLFSGLKFTRNYNAAYDRTMYIGYGDFFTFEDCTIEGYVNTFTQGDLTFDTCLFDGLDGTHEYATQIQQQSGGAGSPGPITIQDCTFQNYSARGIWIMHASDSNIITRNTINACVTGIDIDNYGWTRQSDTNEVSYNKIYDCTNRGCEFENCTNSVMKYNRSYGNLYGLDVITYDAYRGSDSSNLLFGNVIYNSADGGIRIIEADGTKIYHNTIVNNTTSTGCIAIKNGEGTDYGSNTDIQNNIMYQPAASDACLWFPVGAITGVTLNHNIYFNASQVDVIYDEDSATWYTLEEWVAATTYDDNSMQDNPDFTDLGGGDFTLTPQSPCINAGVRNPGYDARLHWSSSWPDGVILFYGKCTIGAYGVPGGAAGM